MDISWVFLVDVPGQRDAWYIEMLTWLTFVSHLPPPSFAVPIQFMRFSPYHRDAATYGFDLVPEPAYAQVYPLGAEEMQQLAYEFVDRGASREEGIGQRLLLAWLGLWREEHRNGTPPVLEMRRDGDVIDIVDTRFLPRRRSPSPARRRRAAVRGVRRGGRSRRAARAARHRSFRGARGRAPRGQDPPRHGRTASRACRRHRAAEAGGGAESGRQNRVGRRVIARRRAGARRRG